MAMFYVMHDVEDNEKGEVMAVKGHNKALKDVNLNKPRAQVHLRCVGGGRAHGAGHNNDR